MSNNTTKNKIYRFIGYVVTAMATNLVFIVGEPIAPALPSWTGIVVGAVASYAVWYWPGVITKDSSTKKIHLALACSLVALALISIPVARLVGAAHAKEAKARLVLVWPNLMQMPERDRAFVVALAMNCRLEKRPATKGEVIACLKEGTTAERGIFPVGLDRSSAPGKLDQMLVIANNALQQGERHE